MENNIETIRESVYEIKGEMNLLRKELYRHLKQLAGLLMAILFTLIYIAFK